MTDTWRVKRCITVIIVINENSIPRTMCLDERISSGVRNVVVVTDADHRRRHVRILVGLQRVTQLATCTNASPPSRNNATLLLHCVECFITRTERFRSSCIPNCVSNFSC